MANWCTNIIEMPGIAKMSEYYTGSSFDFQKIKPAPKELVEATGTEYAAIIAYMSNGFITSVRALSRTKARRFIDCSAECFLGDIAQYVLEDILAKPPKNKESVPEGFKKYLEIAPEHIVLYSLRDIKKWIKELPLPEKDNICMNWAEAMRKKYRHTPTYMEKKSHLQRKGMKYFANYESYGAVTWHDWHFKNWGTVRNSCDTKIINDDLIEFDTAWNPPVPILKTVSAEHPSLTMRCSFYEENGIEGNYVILNGEIMTHEEHWAYES